MGSGRGLRWRPRILGGLCDEAGDLGEVVGEDAVSGPGSGAGEGVHVGSSAAVVAFDAVDASFGSGAPSDHALEASAVLDSAPRRAGSSLAGDADLGDAKVTELGFDGRFSIAAIGGHRARCSTSERLEPFDRWDELWGISGVADLNHPVHDDAIGVVENLSLVTELDRSAETSFADRTGVGVMQGDDPGRTRGCDVFHDSLEGLGLWRAKTWVTSLTSVFAR